MGIRPCKVAKRGASAPFCVSREMRENEEKIREAENYSPWKDFRKRFFQRKGALPGVFFVLFLWFAAISAPLLANGKPLLLYMDSVLSFPAFAALFSPESPEIFVEKSFNFLLLFLPAALLLFFLLRKRKKRYLSGALAACFLLLLIPFAASKGKIDRTPYRELVQKVPGSFAIFAPVPYGPFEMVAPPYEKSSSKHLFGTDQTGRDVLARMIYGARVSLTVGFAATFISLLLGTILGLAAGYKGGKLDLYLMRFVEIVICFPTFLLLLILMSILLDSGSRQSILLVTAVIGLTSWTGLARMVRGETLKERNMAYIRSCESLGLPVRRILFRHLLPNVSSPIFVIFTFDVAGAILAESSLSFLGFGVQDPTSSWGELLRQAFPDPLTYWHLMFFPGLAIFLTVCSFNAIGEGLRIAFSRQK